MYQFVNLVLSIICPSLNTNLRWGIHLVLVCFVQVHNLPLVYPAISANNESCVSKDFIFESNQGNCLVKWEEALHKLHQRKREEVYSHSLTNDKFIHLTSPDCSMQDFSLSRPTVFLFCNKYYSSTHIHFLMKKCAMCISVSRCNAPRVDGITCGCSNQPYGFECNNLNLSPTME